MNLLEEKCEFYAVSPKKTTTDFKQINFHLSQDNWLPPVCFKPWHFCKEGFQEDENAFFSPKNTLPSS